jgi:coenzyme F420-reducing hydrogenase delta subunit
MKNQRKLERIKLDLEELEEEVRSIDESEKLKEVINMLDSIYLTD